MQSIKYPITVRFSKAGDMIYFSQLDLIKILGRAMRRASLPIYFTQGFSPRIKISLLSGSKVGVEGTIEVRFYFLDKLSFSDLKDSLSSQLPAGLELISELEV